MVSVLFALLTALFNGLASVLQRMAAATAPASKALRLSLFSYLIRRKVWLAGIGMVMLAAVCQAARSRFSVPFAGEVSTITG